MRAWAWVVLVAVVFGGLAAYGVAATSDPMMAAFAAVYAVPSFASAALLGVLARDPARGFRAPDGAFPWPALLPAGALAFFVARAIDVGEVFVLLAAVGIAGMNVPVAWWVWADASRRGRDRVGWGVLAAVADLVGLALYAAFAARPPRSPAPAAP